MCDVGCVRPCVFVVRGVHVLNSCFASNKCIVGQVQLHSPIAIANYLHSAPNQQERWGHVEAPNMAVVALAFVRLKSVF